MLSKIRGMAKLKKLRWEKHGVGMKMFPAGMWNSVYWLSPAERGMAVDWA